jgi:6,7-dimethyl-8-ribityllumazine synthase
MNQLEIRSQSRNTTGGPEEPWRIAFIQSCRHREIVDQCRAGFRKEIAKTPDLEKRIDFYDVPGAFEIPLHAKLLAKTGRYQAIVAAGFVVDGGIYRHEFVAQSVISALMRVQLETEIPIISAVLTPKNFHAHEEHQRFFHEHLVVKGIEAAVACRETIGKLARLRDDRDAGTEPMTRPTKS